MKEVTAFLWVWVSQIKSLEHMKGLLHLRYHPVFTYCPLEKNRALKAKNYVHILESFYSEESMDADHCYISSKEGQYRSLSDPEILHFSKKV